MNPQHAADTHGRLRVIAGDHLHANPRLLAGLDCVNGFWTRRVHHACDAQEDQAVIQALMGERGGFCTPWLPGCRNHAQTFFRIARDLRFPVILRKGFNTGSGLL